MKSVEELLVHLRERRGRLDSKSDVSKSVWTSGATVAGDEVKADVSLKTVSIGDDQTTFNQAQPDFHRECGIDADIC